MLHSTKRFGRLLLRGIALFFAAVSRLLGWTNRSVAALGIAAGVGLAFANVVARYLFNSSLPWAAELTNYLFIWSVFFGAAYCFKKDAHISVDIVLEKVSPRTAKALMLFSHSVTLVFLAAVAWYGYRYLLLEIELDERSVDLEIPMWIPYLAIPLAFFSAAFRVAEKIAEIIRTPAENVVRNSEAEMILAEMEASAAGKDLLKAAGKQNGGVL